MKLKKKRNNATLLLAIERKAEPDSISLLAQCGRQTPHTMHNAIRARVILVIRAASPDIYLHSAASRAQQALALILFSTYSMQLQVRSHSDLICLTVNICAIMVMSLTL